MIDNRWGTEYFNIRLPLPTVCGIRVKMIDNGKSTEINSVVSIYHFVIDFKK